MRNLRHAIVPPYLLARLAASASPAFPRAADAAQRTLLAPRSYTSQRSRLTFSMEDGELVAGVEPAPDRVVSDAGNSTRLPGLVVRREADPAGDDTAVNEAFDGLGATFDLFAQAFGRNSIDGAGMPLRATVHYGLDYDNAFWDGTQMVFGDGDGEVFAGFTSSVSIIGHELAHGVTEHSGGLVYQGQSGALNESMSDVFGALTEQHAIGQTADEASWLIGAGVFTDAVQGDALRSMKAPGTAYDDDVLGKDPQPAHMRDFVETSDDNGGVHINSGIPNHAFHLVATTLGGRAWERAGLIWYRTLTGGTLSPTSDFAAFAGATLATASALFPPSEGEGGAESEETAAVRAAWAEVGVQEHGAEPAR
ncbi:MAG: M4 family metallopeptidase [Microbacterium sp.]|uniref:M4 family metallopeptidase n=1 Tax=Microbacterium sp. TaxID=51671 RepID=UPI0039E26334